MRRIRWAALLLALGGLGWWIYSVRQARVPGERSEFTPPVAMETGGATEASGDPLCQIPSSPPSPQGSLAEFADYSWRLFVALNWPAAHGERGVSDCAAAFGGGPTVWETYKTTEQVFLPGGANPGPWDAGEMGLAKLRYRAKAPQGLPVENSIRQAVGGWLIDQNSNPTYYQIGLDEASYDYIRQNQYYNRDVVSQASSVEFPDGSLEIKASWRILEEGEPEDRFHSRDAEVVVFDAEGNPTGETKEARVALVGFHAIYKATGFPQWIWTTFEHRDNAPTEQGGDTAGTWSYFNPECSGPYCEPNASPLESGQPFGSPNQLTRITPLEEAVTTANATWAGKPKIASTPFAYYELISPQWPTAPNDPGQPQGAPVPSTVANITLESYIQPTSSCMDCHSTARVPGDGVKSNYSFIFLFAQSPNGDDS